MPDSSHIYYAEQDVERLRTGLQNAEGRFEDLLYRYRLYPLTEEADLLNDLPKSLDDGTAQELAVLSGLWAYRAGEASMLGALRYGRRSMNVLSAAKERDRFNPFVLLVEGQSLLYRPSIAGRDPDAAATCFEQLRTVLDAHPDVSIDKEEAMIWHWIALQEANQDTEAASLYDKLAESNLPPLYQQFLESPPRV
ncbi:hypothetical protein CRI93_14370 [Longimonas halophila]|uniref:Tetratricopeptide repeat protein n=2 Tax=Longimonas halophila TaxID=1469170 RepID=A0A2H3NU14_9BACT|nr:hypothetical protein CRI93_14370 [Longimonas halophila]